MIKSVDYSFSVEAVHGVVERLLGVSMAEKFVFKRIPMENGKHVFELDNQADKIMVSGSSPVAMSFGLNWYLKYNCQASFSWSGNQLHIPEPIPKVEGKVRKVRPYDYFYHLNYVTFSYSTVFWDWERWEKELDWMALNGIDLVLELTGHEEVWRRTLSRVGYTDEEIKKYLTGPAYLPFQWLGCMYGWGGDLSDNWFRDRLQLAEKIHKRMRELGMTRVLQAYTGIVPPDFKEKVPESNPLDQGDWVGLERPFILLPDDPIFSKMAEIFYEEQKNLFGHDHFYAGDPFHEGGNLDGIDLKKAAELIQNELVKADDQAVWVLQAWWENPTTAFMKGLDKNHTMILDLWGENSPRWKREGEDVFFGLPWVWSFLQNFGGRSGLYGDMSGSAHYLLEALHHSHSGDLVGVGFTGEGIEQNPVMYDLMTEMSWRSEIDMKEWLRQYVIRRYGRENEDVQRAWELLKESAYGYSKQPGPTHSVINKRPSKADVIKNFDHNEQKKWDSLEIYYDPSLVEEACQLLYRAYAELTENDGYLYDLVDVTRQALANKARRLHRAFMDAYKNQDISAFSKSSSAFLKIIRTQDRLLNTRKEFLLGPWLEQAKSLGKTKEEKALYEYNARALITIWASPAQEILHDYGHKEWAGLTMDFYFPRWQKHIDALRTSLETGEPLENIDWFEWEYAWTQKNNEFPIEPEGDIHEIVGGIIQEVFSE
ncbi:alpha-N-acetylglucosaminidase [Bacillus sp. SD088]|uniref:alpha-N-acetylglucosaminidase n=1 Tax=Bacillus sp. SD088 TaxID=2782012 RepID=UPI001A95C4E2|nr:alpha-N-acetylglucosaminidase [Bacillus sp. SD088]MBO0991959.1 alpha-N-acetylglucosaminidase [Bacillus sp. SD088]